MTHTPNNGGPAFPQSDVLFEDGCELVRTSHGGMSLRDYFAGQVLASLPRKYMAEALWQVSQNLECVAHAEHASYVAYDIADAMLAARLKS